jgi:hypothetical protein
MPPVPTLPSVICLVRLVGCRPANGLGSNGFNGLGFQMGALWMGRNGLIYLAGWV